MKIDSHFNLQFTGQLVNARLALKVSPAIIRVAAAFTLLGFVILVDIVHPHAVLLTATLLRTVLMLLSSMTMGG